MNKNNDTISRQSAIQAAECIVDHHAITPYQTMRSAMDHLQRILRGMPSAQPEIIRCKDCKYSEHWYRDKCRCFLWAESGIGVFDDGFCNYAERRTDE